MIVYLHLSHSNKARVLHFVIYTYIYMYTFAPAKSVGVRTLDVQRMCKQAGLLCVPKDIHVATHEDVQRTRMDYTLVSLCMLQLGLLLYGI